MIFYLFRETWSLHHVSFWFKVTRRGCYHAFLAWVLIITSTKTWNGWPCHGCLASGSKKAFHDFTIKSAGLSGGHSFNQSLEQLTLPSSLLSMNFSMFCFDHNFNQNLAWVTFGNLDRMKAGNMGIQPRLKKKTCLPIFYGVVCQFLFLQSLGNVWPFFRSKPLWGKFLVTLPSGLQSFCFLALGSNSAWNLRPCRGDLAVGTFPWGPCRGVFRAWVLDTDIVSTKTWVLGTLPSRFAPPAKGRVVFFQQQPCFFWFVFMSIFVSACIYLYLVVWKGHRKREGYTYIYIYTFYIYIHMIYIYIYIYISIYIYTYCDR